MARPKGQCREVCVNVAPWCVLPGPPQFECHSACFALERLNLDLCDARFPAHVVVADPHHSPEQFSAPECEAEFDVRQLGKVRSVKVNVHSDQAKQYQQAVNVQECLVERVAKWRRCCEDDEAEHHRGEHSPSETLARSERKRDLARAGRPVHVDRPGNCVQDSLKHHDAGAPSVNEVESIVADSGDPYERVVPERKKYCRYDVDRSQLACPASQFSDDRVALQVAPVKSQAVGEIGCEKYGQQDGVES